MVTQVAAAAGIERDRAAPPVPRWGLTCLGLFMIALALYHLPWTRLSSAGAGIPLFPLFAVPLLPLAVGRAVPDVLRPLVPALLVLLGLIFATALAGMVNPDQDWAEALKRIGYLGLGIVLAVVSASSSAAFLAAAWTYVLTAGALSVYGFVLLATGAAKPLFYFGLHYTESTRNSDAFFLLAPAFLALGLLLRPGGSRAARAVAGLAAGVMLGALILSFSRGAWFSVAFGLVLLTGTRGRARKAALGSLAGLALAASIALPALTNVPVTQQMADRLASIVQLNDAGGNSNLQRAQLLKTSLDLIAAHPVAGVGVSLVGPALLGTELAGLSHTEDAYLNMQVEYGLAGLLVIVLFTAWPLVRLRRTGGDMLLRSAWCGLAAVAVDSLVNTPQATADFWIVPLVIAAAAHRADTTR